MPRICITRLWLLYMVHEWPCACLGSWGRMFMYVSATRAAYARCCAPGTKATSSRQSASACSSAPSPQRSWSSALACHRCDICERTCNLFSLLFEWRAARVACMLYRAVVAGVNIFVRANEGSAWSSPSALRSTRSTWRATELGPRGGLGPPTERFGGVRTGAAVALRRDERAYIFHVPSGDTRGTRPKRTYFCRY